MRARFKITGKTLIFCLVSAFLVLPGCTKKRKKGVAERLREAPVHKIVKGSKKGAVPVAMADLPEVKYFDGGLEGFVLEEDVNAFSPDAVLSDDFKAMTVAQSDQAGDEAAWVEDADSQFNFKTVYFGFDEHNVKPDQKVVLAYDMEVAKAAAEAGKEVVCEAHACHSAGSKTYNLSKSEKRGWTVASALRDAGIPEGSIKVVGRGAEMPAVQGGDRDQQWPNRRVDFKIV